MLRSLLLAAPLTLALMGVAQAAPAAGPGALTGLWLIDQQNYDAHSEGEVAPTPSLTEAAKTLASAQADVTLSDNGKKCLPIGMPGMVSNEFALEFLETPGKVTVISEDSPISRTISLTRKTHDLDREPSWNGDSIGHWEGATLVVETTNLNDRVSHIPRTRGVSSLTTKIVERYHLEDGGKTLINQMTFTDPNVLTRPFTVTRRYHRGESGAELWEYVCEVDAAGWSERFAGDPEFKPGAKQ